MYQNSFLMKIQYILFLLLNIAVLNVQVSGFASSNNPRKNTLQIVHTEDILEKRKKIQQREKLLMQNINCHSSSYCVSQNFKNAVSINFNQFDNGDFLWKSLVMKQHFLVCIYALGYVTGTLNAYSCCLRYLIWRYCLSLLLLVSFHVMLPLSYHFILFLLSVTESWPLSLCSISTSFYMTFGKRFCSSTG